MEAEYVPILFDECFKALGILTNGTST